MCFGCNTGTYDTGINSNETKYMQCVWIIIYQYMHVWIAYKFGKEVKNVKKIILL